MTTSHDVHQKLRMLLLAYERLDGAWRHRFGLSANEKLAVMYLAEGVTSPGDLAEALGLTSAGVTNLLDRLEEQGLIRRDPHPTDRRRVLVRLTKSALMARLEFERVSDAMAEVPDEAIGAVVGAFLDRATKVATQGAVESQEADEGTPTDDAAWDEPAPA